MTYLLEYLWTYQVLLSVLVGVNASASTLKVWGYQVVMMIIPLGDSIGDQGIRLLMTTGLIGFITYYKLITPYHRIFLLVNSLLVLYLSTYIVSYYNNYEFMLILHNSGLHIKLEYLVLLLLINYKGLIINARDYINKFKYSVLNSYRRISLAYMEVKRGQGWK